MHFVVASSGKMSNLESGRSDDGWDWKAGKITAELPAIITKLPANMETCKVKLVKVEGTVATLDWSVFDIILWSSPEEPDRFFPRVLVVGEDGLLEDPSLPRNWEHATFQLELSSSVVPNLVETKLVTYRIPDAQPLRRSKRLKSQGRARVPVVPSATNKPAPAQTENRQKLTSVIWQHGESSRVGTERYWTYFYSDCSQAVRKFGDRTDGRRGGKYERVDIPYENVKA
ncbi:hypothetical protein BZA05DRAFT_419288 [Tricharina praecox]|uniref:uncharacterized protein n=1 Tax=Tricharina praecox TaxID=43433 RepID=UPI00221F393C|nr:uncharacterized protein BZA05DRAFT_419288 [Tricharina praecox]KAI5850777.1 hypothetical protein BZA05DRAFT_419288 [Tricharina praecox]